MGIILSKKGIMFTILSVLVCALIITSFFTFQSVPLDSEVDNVKLRIKSIDRYVSETDVYIKSITDVASTKTVKFMNDIMMGNNSFLDNYTKQFENCLMTGKLNVTWNKTNLINCPNDSKIYEKFDFLENFSKSKLNIDSNITLHNVRLSQETPWALKVWINYTILINDTYALWNETRLIYTTVSIIGLSDPTSYIMGNMTDIYQVRYKTTVNTTLKQREGKAEYWYQFPYAVSQQYVLNKHYIKWIGAPSYLNRLNNITTPSPCCGIVLIVSNDFIDESKLTPPPAINRSYLDFEFWKNTNVNYYYYRMYNFWLGGASAATYRAQANITSVNPGLNGSIVRDEIASFINMTNTSYLLQIS